MRRLILILTLLALPAMAGSYTVATNATQDTHLERWRVRLNRQTCATYGLPASCTQPQARKAFCEQNGFGGVTGCTGSAAVRIYADIQTMLDDQVTAVLFEQFRAQLASDDKAAARAAWLALTRAQRDAVCTSLGLAAQCDPW